MTDVIAVIGQGYVGLPLSLAFSRHYPVIGFDVNAKRIAALQDATDWTKEVRTEQLEEAIALGVSSGFTKGYRASANLEEIESATIYIVTVPTPIDAFNAPDLSFLRSASKMIGSLLKKNDLVIYESTVYPGCTEEDCVPILEKASGLVFNEDFFVGYSPERINPGDKVRTLENTIKITSGSTPAIADRVDALYQTIISAGTHKAASIKVAEAAKAIENAQRDVNISFVNELSLIFDRIGIDTQNVLAAASTKYNFLQFRPGLVGGHCISVDPYYLAHKSSQLGYHPEVILSGRRVNDRMGEFIAGKTVKLMIKKGITIKGARVLILGLTFKENCPDIRNSKVVDVYEELKAFGLTVDVCDPWANVDEVKKEYGIDLLRDVPSSASLASEHRSPAIAYDSGLGALEEMDQSKIDEMDGSAFQKYDAVILAVAHTEFLSVNLADLKSESAVVFDVKAIWPAEMVDARL
ncbi:nucleotide sugar dehydrogenase [Sphingobacterium oryzagri]|uniref:Nucleotide sugar dehydrogenase n=1 Tax=Sphingobacterium oryzagri TaxID=3025669 RepID=A0ABY7WNN9_9SPHI|nr:nucleotide sugar dehydrogenase [Sphingobacterium sp. KACC 22765]WDF68954.1 nucleotide sugar dehydrogenase [Sphingobacterium sp. KACC 22765]